LLANETERENGRLTSSVEMKRFSDATTDGLDAGDIDKADSNVSRIVKHPSATHIILH